MRLVTSEFAEDLAQVVSTVLALMNSRAVRSPVGQVPGHHPGDLRLLRREHLRGPRAARAGPLTGGLQLGPGPPFCSGQGRC